MGSLTGPKLPVIDFPKDNLKPGSSSWLSTSNAVSHALEEYGCFLAVHGEASSDIHDNMFHHLKELFDLPTEIKVQNTSDKLGFGYGGNFSNLLIEYMGIENAATLEGTQSFTNLIWSAGNDAFCETAVLYSKLLAELYHIVMQMVFENYGVQKSCDSLVQSTLFLLRLMKYRGPQMNGTNTGLIPHTDKDFLTVLDTNQVKGLEIETKEGEWIIYEPLASTFLVIAGEPFMAWSNGRIYAPLHRVVMRGNEVRYSIGLFSYMRETVKTPEELVDDEHPLHFKPFNHLAFLKYCGEEGRKFKCPIKAFCGV